MLQMQMQGGVLTPLKCSVQMDTLGLECLSSVEHSEILYKYKGFVNIPRLEFVNDTWARIYQTVQIYQLTINQ